MTHMNKKEYKITPCEERDIWIALVLFPLHLIRFFGVLIVWLVCRTNTMLKNCSNREEIQNIEESK